MFSAHRPRISSISTLLLRKSMLRPFLNRTDSSAKIGRIRGGEKKDIGALGETHCMSADDQMEKALERMYVEPQDAEMTFVRHYQGRHNVCLQFSSSCST